MLFCRRLLSLNKKKHKAANMVAKLALAISLINVSESLLKPDCISALAIFIPPKKNKNVKKVLCLNLVLSNLLSYLIKRKRDKKLMFISKCYKLIVGQ